MKPDTTFHSPKIPSKKSLPKDLTILRGVSKKCWLFFLQTWVKPILRIAPMKTEYDLEICLSNRAQATKLTEFQ